MDSGSVVFNGTGNLVNPPLFGTIFINPLALVHEVWQSVCAVSFDFVLSRDSRGPRSLEPPSFDCVQWA
ncbi:hypothetical protein A6X21_02935 [Planctopirus hydrillae]|uniref:Uncharacterized protein n=1 Tax=Planctopirus hydrillae TaxID=1841610 RepID=A0A1C3EN53_9PLAN|nr:hypothetical protein A6X21_02935 [Planctopirus hydrillae]